ncbi:MAG: glycosyltransferase family 2 protein [Acidobacteriaceae bacterium]|nr:glycosyltransferase family 2 protein [Acidobacteriaceae bacterium]
MNQLSVVILTFNEEGNLPVCLDSLQPLACPVFIVDSGSSDRTLDIARRYGAAVYQHAFENHTQQWSWALANLPIRSHWILALDADQRLTPELAQEILAETMPGANEHLAGMFLNRRQIFRGRWIKHGGYYPKYLLKLFRPECVQFDSLDLVDHHFYIDGKTRKLKHDLIEANVKENDIAFWIEKHNRYSTLLASEELLRSAHAASIVRPSLGGNPDQRVLMLKGIWRKCPLLFRSVAYFFYRYVFLGGWRDGEQGFVFHFLQGFWFRLLIDIKLRDLLQQAAAERDYISGCITQSPHSAARKYS